MADKTAVAAPATGWRLGLRNLSYALFAVSLVVAIVGFFGSNQLVQWSGIAVASWANVGVWIARREGIRAAFLGAIVMTVAAAAIVVFKV